MTAEFIATMGDNGGTSYTLDHDVTRYAVGDAENLRAKLVDALEQMGYRVVNENPILARRSAKTCATSGCSQNILDYQTTLNIGLKSNGANSTRVTFDYTVRHMYSGYAWKGDRNTLTREADAILALALARAASAHCQACGADTAGSSRFCRQCGSPLTAAIPAEVELLKLTADANAGYKNLAGGICFVVFGAALLLVLLFGGNDPVKFAKLVKIISFFSITFGSIGLTMLGFGLSRLRNAIKQDGEQDSTPTPSRKGFNAPNTAALPPQSVGQSVTESTTDLLPQKVERAS